MHRGPCSHRVTLAAVCLESVAVMVGASFSVAFENRAHAQNGSRVHTLLTLPHTTRLMPHTKRTHTFTHYSLTIRDESKGFRLRTFEYIARLALLLYYHLYLSKCMYASMCVVQRMNYALNSHEIERASANARVTELQTTRRPHAAARVVDVLHPSHAKT